MKTALTYNEAVSTLREALKFGINPSLEPITKMCAAMGDPQKTYKCIQIAGTNGKSSTSRMVAAILRERGAKVGLYTSPHLVKYSERVEVDGAVVSDRLFADGVSAALDAAAAAGVEATEFELLTAAALWIFAHEQVEWAVLECGLGGRWDATTVVDPCVAVITGIGLDHTRILGDTVEKIAAEKAAIIKPGSTAVIAHNIAARPVIDARIAEVGAEVREADIRAADEYKESLAHLPSYQNLNAATALSAVAAALGSAPDHDVVASALEKLVVPGRFEVLRKEPLLMVDAAHNPQSARVLAREVSRRFVTATAPDSIAEAQLASGKPRVPTLLIGVLADKDVRGVVEALAPLFDRIVTTASRSPRSISARHLAKIVTEVTGEEPEVTESVPAGLKLLAGTPTLATGSITVAGEVKRYWC